MSAINSVKLQLTQEADDFFHREKDSLSKQGDRMESFPQTT